MNLFEKIMTSTGKRVYHLFFLISVLLLCKACAQYFFYAEQNFKCPICEILKSARKLSQVSVNYAECISCYNTAPTRIETEVQKTQIDNKYLQHSAQIHLYSLFGISKSRKQIVSATKENEIGRAHV